MDIVKIEQIVKLALGIVLGVIAGFVVGMLTNLSAAILVTLLCAFIFCGLLYKRREVLEYSSISDGGDKAPNPNKP